MADKSLLEQMLERLVNDDQAKAEELFHEYVVAKSREIYENLIEAEMDDEDEEVDEATEDDEDEEKVDESADEDEDDEKVDEEFEDIAYEAGDEMGGDPTDDLESELDAEAGDDEDMGDKDPAELFQDLDAIVDELQAKFDAMGGGDDMGGEMGDDEEMKDDMDLETVREYVEKVPGGHGAEKKGQGEGQYSGTGSQSDKVSLNAKSIVAGKNDMGGTASNLNQAGTENAPVEANKGHLKGSSLFKGTPKEDNAGNINVPGGKAGNAFSKKEPGHGAEKKGQPEGKYSGTGSQSDSVTVSKQSLFRGRR